MWYTMAAKAQDFGQTDLGWNMDLQLIGGITLGKLFI